MMIKNIILFLMLAVCPLTAFSGPADDYLVDLGKTFMEQGRMDEAEVEFEKALIVNPANKQAISLLKDIRGKEISKTLDIFAGQGKTPPVVEKVEVSTEPPAIVEKTEVSEEPPVYVAPVEKSEPEDVTIAKAPAATDEYGPPVIKGIHKQPQQQPEEKVVSQQPEYQKPVRVEDYIVEESPGQEEEEGVTVSGEVFFSMGWKGDDFIWNRADSNLNEENWRTLSDAGYNNLENTYDPAIFDRIRVEVSKQPELGFGFHTNVDLSPWSYIGKSDTQTIATNFGDTVDVQLKSWGNSKYIVPEVVYTHRLGDSFGLGEQKVDGERVFAYTTSGTFAWHNLTIPDTSIHYEFWPMRELWFDYNNDVVNLRVFPVALEDQALTSDDPLTLTNHRSYWEESQWLVKWHPGHCNSGTANYDYFPGFWDDSLAFVSRDSSGTWLTNLRGLSLNFDFDRTTIDFTAASPKELWQDYTSFETWGTALRPKFYATDNLTLGMVHATKMGYRKRTLDAFNQVIGFDLTYGLTPNTNVAFEIAGSDSEKDILSDYTAESRGYVYHINMVHSSQDEAFGKTYYELKPDEKDTSPFYRLKLAFTHMDLGFESALSSYRETRDDAFWGRHLTFREPFKYYYSGVYGPALGWEDMEPFKIGDGIDVGRDVVNFRIESQNLLDDKLDTLFDVRNVHNADGDFIENVSRLEVTYQLTDRITTKGLGIYHVLPKTEQGVDPFLIEAASGDYLENNDVEYGKDPTLKTISLGAKYDFTDWTDISFIWERTNDSTVAYDNSPRGLYTYTYFATYNEYGKTFRQEVTGLNNTTVFDLPPYHYFDIYKVGLGLRPTDDLEIYLDFTRNEYEWVQLIDDNMNHIGLEIAYTPTDKLALYLRYVYSKVKDWSDLNYSGRVFKKEHHYGFAEVRLRLEETSELIAQYGVGSTPDIVATFTPFGGGIPTLDLQHLFKLYYRKKF